MCPTAYAIVRTVSPNARATPRNPIPSCRLAPVVRFGARWTAENTAAPHPPRTRTNVPRNSAARRWGSVGVTMGSLCPTASGQGGDDLVEGGRRAHDGLGPGGVGAVVAADVDR